MTTTEESIMPDDQAYMDEIQRQRESVNFWFEKYLKARTDLREAKLTISCMEPYMKAAVEEIDRGSDYNSQQL